MIAHLERLSRHGAWADARLLAATRAARGNTETVLRELAHVRGAQATWLARIHQRPSALPVWPTLTLDQIESAGALLDRELHDFIASLTPDALERTVSYRNSAGDAYTTPIGEIMLHLLTHGQYHRGKANAALRAIGAEPVAVDFIVWQREMPSAQS